MVFKIIENRKKEIENSKHLFNSLTHITHLLFLRHCGGRDFELGSCHQHRFFILLQRARP